MKKKLACLFLLCAAAYPQVAEKANEGYKTKEGRASVAKNLIDPARSERQRPRDIVDQMGLQPGQSVADVGTGVGFMLPYLSRAVGDIGTVYAEDIQQEFLNQAQTRANSLGVKNVKFVLGTDRDPNLPANTLSAVLILDVYHHFDYPEAMLGHIRDSLVSNGKLVIVEYYKRRGAMPNGGDPDRAIQHIRLDEDDLIREVEMNGFKVADKHELVPKSQYIVTFVKK
jgi:ubiquinone/menaquinone biosynthesis C-methylase UbiE